MKCLNFLALFISLLISTFSFSQQSIFLQKISNHKKIKVLDLDREYNIKTTDNIFCSKILDVTDSSLILIGQVPTGKDSLLVQKYFSKPSDSTIVHLSKTDTINILFTRIQYIRKAWFKNNKWVEYPVSFFSIPAILGLVGLPIAAIVLNNEDFKTYAITEGVLIGATLIPIIIGNGGRKFDTQRTWKIITANNNVR